MTLLNVPSFLQHFFTQYRFGLLFYTFKKLMKFLKACHALRWCGTFPYCVDCYQNKQLKQVKCYRHLLTKHCHLTAYRNGLERKLRTCMSLVRIPLGFFFTSHFFFFLKNILKYQTSSKPVKVF